MYTIWYSYFNNNVNRTLMRQLVFENVYECCAFMSYVIDNQLNIEFGLYYTLFDKDITIDTSIVLYYYNGKITLKN